MLERDAPEAAGWFRPPLSEESIAQEADAIGVELGEDLREWFSLHNGSEIGRRVFGFGWLEPLDAQLFRTYENMLSVARGSTTEITVPRGEGDLVRPIPIVASHGEWTFVEAQGPKSGAVCQFTDAIRELFANIDDMLAQAVDLYECGWVRVGETGHGVGPAFEVTAAEFTESGLVWQSSGQLLGRWPQPTTTWDAMGLSFGAEPTPIGPRDLCVGSS